LTVLGSDIAETLSSGNGMQLVADGYKLVDAGVVVGFLGGEEIQTANTLLIFVFSGYTVFLHISANDLLNIRCLSHCSACIIVNPS